MILDAGKFPGAGCYPVPVRASNRRIRGLWHTLDTLQPGEMIRSSADRPRSPEGRDSEFGWRVISRRRRIGMLPTDVPKYLVDNGRVCDKGNDLYPAAAF